MECFHPVRLKERIVPCGRCLPCLRKRQLHWAIRMEEESKLYVSNSFITLTYNPESVPCVDGHQVLIKKDFQDFMKRLRFAISPHKVRYFAVGEYGPTTFRPHFHLILFNAPENLYDLVFSTWNKGFITVSSLTSKRIFYCAKYVTMHLEKMPEFYKDYPQFMLCSRRPGIGASLLDNDEFTDFYRTTLTNYFTRDGFKVSIPRYYRDRLFDSEMKEVIQETNESVLFYKKWMQVISDWQRSDKNLTLSDDLLGGLTLREQRQKACYSSYKKNLYKKSKI